MTAPLVPADVDLTDFAFMPFEFGRLFKSETWILSNDAEKVAALTLWGKSWTEVPAGSIPDDDRMLAHLSGAGPRWKRLKAMALRGWVRADDGRMYHPVVCEKALEAWYEKLSQRLSSGAGNAKRWGIDFDPTDIEAQIIDTRRLLKALNPDSRMLSKRKPPAIPPGSKNDPTGTPGRNPPGIPSGSQETETETEIHQEQEQKHARIDSPETPATPARSTDAGRACLLLRQAGCARVNPGHPDLLAALAEGVTPEALRDTYAEKPNAANPFAWAIATARGRHAEGPKQISTGPPTARASSDSKTLTALKKLQGLKTDETLSTRVVAERNPGRLIETRDAES